MLQIGILIIAVPMIYSGIQGLRNRPDSPKGKQTSKPVAVACLILAVAMLVCAFIVIPIVTQETLEPFTKTSR